MVVKNHIKNSVVFATSQHFGAVKNYEQVPANPRLDYYGIFWHL